MGDDFGDFRSGDAVLLRCIKVVCERRVGNPLADERGDGNKATVAQTEEVVAAPHLAEKDVIVEVFKLGRNSPNCVRPAVCTIFFCAITLSVIAINKVNKTVLFIF